VEIKTRRKTIVREALACIFGQGYFGRSEYSVPGEVQLSIEESEFAFGNTDCLADENYYARMSALPCFRGKDAETVRSVLDKRQFRIVCGKTDVTLEALEAVYELRQKYGIRKFLLLASDASAREQFSRTISVMQDYFSDKYYGLKLNIMTYDSDDFSRLRTFALSDDIQLLIINKEYFIRSNNLLKRPSARLDGLCPADMLRPARCVALTVSDDMKAVRAAVKYASVFDPLCTVCFTKNNDEYLAVPTIDPTELKTSESEELSVGFVGGEENFQLNI